jgi:hypothetical protein
MKPSGLEALRDHGDWNFEHMGTMRGQDFPVSVMGCHYQNALASAQSRAQVFFALNLAMPIEKAAKS